MSIFYEYGLVPRERGTGSAVWWKDAAEERVVCFHHNAVCLSKYIHFSISLHCVSYMTTFNKAGYVCVEKTLQLHALTTAKLLLLSVKHVEQIIIRASS